MREHQRRMTPTPYKEGTDMSTTARTDIYTRVTDRIIADLEQGVRPWMKPWNADHTAGRITRPLRHNGTPYNGVNILLLWGAALENGYDSRCWMTYRQASELNAQVKKGEHGALVVYADRFTRIEAGNNGEDVEREIPFMKAYTVFNVEQIEGLPDHYTAKPAPKGEPLQLLDGAERFFAATGAIERLWEHLRHGNPFPSCPSGGSGYASSTLLL